MKKLNNFVWKRWAEDTRSVLWKVEATKYSFGFRCRRAAEQQSLLKRIRNLKKVSHLSTNNCRHKSDIYTKILPEEIQNMTLTGMELKYQIKHWVKIHDSTKWLLRAGKKTKIYIKKDPKKSRQHTDWASRQTGLALQINFLMLCPKNIQTHSFQHLEKYQQPSQSLQWNNKQLHCFLKWTAS